MAISEPQQSQQVIFVGSIGSISATGSVLQAGEDVDYGRVADFFGRAKDDVEAEWLAVVTNTQQLLARLTTLQAPFDLNEVEIELGFSAEGHLGFIAKAGATASVKLKFCRKALSTAEGQAG